MIAIDVGEHFAAMSSMYSRATFTTLPSTAWFTMFIRAQSSPVTFRDDMSRSSAAPVPASRGSSQLTPHSAMSPRCENAMVSTASFAMNRRSHASAIGTAMPAIGPLMAAMIGFGTDMRYVYVPRRSSPHDGSPASASSALCVEAPSAGGASEPSPMPLNIFMSAPAQKPRPA